MAVRLPTGWPPFEAALKAAGVKHTAYVYPNTQHGFHNDTTPRYDAEAAQLAWRRTVGSSIMSCAARLYPFRTSGRPTAGTCRE
jgi:dienelactone hydrolase